MQNHKEKLEKNAHVKKTTHRKFPFTSHCELIALLQFVSFTEEWLVREEVNFIYFLDIVTLIPLPAHKISK